MSRDWKESVTDRDNYQYVKVSRGREFILALKDGADLVLEIQNFLKEKNIRVAQIHGLFEGSLSPARFYAWSPCPGGPFGVQELPVEIQNLSMICSMQGTVHPRVREGKEEVSVKLHGSIGGGWGVPTFGGHFLPGSIVKGICRVFVTEILGIDML